MAEKDEEKRNQDAKAKEEVKDEKTVNDRDNVVEDSATKHDHDAEDSATKSAGKADEKDDQQDYEVADKKEDKEAIEAEDKSEATDDEKKSDDSDDNGADVEAEERVDDASEEKSDKDADAKEDTDVTEADDKADDKNAKSDDEAMAEESKSADDEAESDATVQVSEVKSDEDGSVMVKTKVKEPEAKPDVEINKEAGFSKKAKQALLATGIVAILVGGGIGFAMGHHAGGNQTMLTTAYGKVTNIQIFNRLKYSAPAQNVAQSLVMERVLEHDFPKAATQDKVDQEFKKIKKNKMMYMQYVQNYGGDNEIKSGIKDTLLLGAAMKANVSVSNAELRDAYQDYRPNMTLAFVEIQGKSRAQDIQGQLSGVHSYSAFKNTASDLAKGDSKNISAGLLPDFSSLANDQEVPTNVKKQAMKMKKGDISGLIKTGKDRYAVLYMKSVAHKGSFNSVKGELKDTLLKQKMNNDKLRAKVLAKYAKKAHVKADDDAFKPMAKMLTKSGPMAAGQGQGLN